MRTLRYIFTLSLMVMQALPQTSCVAKRKFVASEQARMEAESRLRDLDATRQALEGDTANLGSSGRRTASELERLRSLSDEERRYLAGELDSSNRQLDQNQRLLIDREKRLRELQAQADRQSQAINNLKNTVANALIGYKGDDLSVELRNGKVYVSLSEKLLFKSGSATVDPKGQEALVKVADVLAKNLDIDIMVEGHTDNVPLLPGKFDDNWDLSVERATAIVRIMTSGGRLDSKRVIAAGRSEYIPIANNDTPEGRSKNRRTEIILSPKLDALYEILNGK